MKRIGLLGIFLLAAFFVIGCSGGVLTFEKGADNLREIDSKYKVDFKTMPSDIESAVMMRNELNRVYEDGIDKPESYELFLSYRIKALEANIIHLKAWEEGNRATTREGFGCKAYEIVMDSTNLRNISAHKGYEAVEILQEFVEKYPDESKLINVTQRDVVFSNFFYSEVENEAARDRRIMSHFCEKKYLNQTSEEN